MAVGTTRPRGVVNITPEEQLAKDWRAVRKAVHGYCIVCGRKLYMRNSEWWCATCGPADLVGKKPPVEVSFPQRKAEPKAAVATVPTGVPWAAKMPVPPKPDKVAANLPQEAADPSPTKKKDNAPPIDKKRDH